MFSLIWAAIIGLIVGALAKFIMPGKDPGGILITMALGVVGDRVDERASARALYAVFARDVCVEYLAKACAAAKETYWR